MSRTLLRTRTLRQRNTSNGWYLSRNGAAWKPSSQRSPTTNRTAAKHVDVADYVRKQVERKRITVSYVKTTVMDADIITKLN